MTKRTRRFAIGGTVIAVIVASAVGVTVWTANHEGGDGTVRIDMNLPEYDDPASGTQWTPKVVNGTGERLDDAEFVVTIDKPGSGLPALTFGELSFDTDDWCYDEGEPEDPECVEDAKQVDAQKCETVTDDEIPETEAYRVTAVKCTKDIAPGTNEYVTQLNSMTAHGLAEEIETFRDFPDVRVHAELTVAGRTVASADDDLAIDHPAMFDSTEFHDFPGELSADRTESEGYDWSFTFTNDSDTAYEDAHITIDVQSGYDAAGIATDRKGCEYLNPHEDYLNPKATIGCEEVDIPAGESITVDMRIFATTPDESPHDECEPVRDSAGCSADVLKGSVTATLAREPDSQEPITMGARAFEVKPAD